MHIYHKLVCRLLRIIPSSTIRVDPEARILWQKHLVGGRSPVGASSRGLGNKGKQPGEEVQVAVEKRRARGVG